MQVMNLHYSLMHNPKSLNYVDNFVGLKRLILGKESFKCCANLAYAGLCLRFHIIH